MMSYNEEEESKVMEMVGFMFGNVDNSGNLDELYLEKLDAKEHLAALVHHLSPSLVGVATNGSGSEEPEDHDLKADNAKSHEDTEVQCKDPKVGLTPEDMQFDVDTALAGLANLVEEDDYDKDVAFDSNLNGLEIKDDDDELPNGQEQCQTNTVDLIALSSNDEEKQDWNEVMEVQETTSSAKEKKEEVAKYPLPVLYQVGGKDVVSFMKLCGRDESYWATGYQKGRHTGGHTRGRAKEGPVAVEDDEEVELKRSPDADFERQSSISKDPQGGSSSIEEDGIMERSPNLSHSHQHRLKRRKLNAFSVAEPMKVDVDFDESKVEESMKQIPNANFVPIHQVEWEDDIVWESTHSSKIDHRRPSTELSDYCEWRRPCVIEPLYQRNSGLEDAKELIMSTKFFRHPQMLRLEAHAFGKQVDVEARAELLNRIRNVILKVEEKNQELARGEWLTGISLEEECGLAKPLVILDLMDPQMVFEASEATSGQCTCLHVAALVLIPRQDEGAHDGAEGASLALTRFNFSNDEYYANKQSHQQQNSNAKKRRAIHVVNVVHSLPAIKLLSMKIELLDKDLANFHRPKAVWYPHHNEAAAKQQRKLAAMGHMEVIVATLSGKGSKLTVDASDTLDVLKAKIAMKLEDLESSKKIKVFHAGKELVDAFTLAQQQVQPNSVLRFVCTKIYPWPKAQRLLGEDEPLRPPGAFKNKSELSVKDGHVALMEYCEERPLLLGNVGMGGRLCTYYRKRSPTDVAAFALCAERGPWMGTSLPLEPKDVSPFLGDIRPGETQSSLETNMYRAPVFPHKVATTDFLLVRSPQGKLSLRQINSVHVVGQQEPHMEVLTPNSRLVKTYRCNRLLAYVYRVFREFKEKPGAIPSPHVRADDIISQFSFFTKSIIRRQLYHCADLKQIGGEMYWVMQPNFSIPSEGELRRMMTPEDACAYESMQAGLHHLKRMGIYKLTQTSGLAAAKNQLPNEQKIRSIASHIERELQLTPWNLSHNFVAATTQGLGSLEQLEIVGAGDPSGRGLGSSYLRAAAKPNTVGALVAKEAAVARGGASITGSDADLRCLGTEAARLILLKFQVPEETISKLSRWHRIGLIRKLSSKQAASGVEHGATELNKFARGQKMSFLQLRQQIQEKCQGVWDSQVQSLSMADGDDSEGDGEGGGEPFIGDLENHLKKSDEGASEDLDDFADFLESQIIDKSGDEKGKQEGMGGSRARLLKPIAQEGEDSEEDEAEATGLMQMLHAGDEVGEKQKETRSVPAINGKELEGTDLPLSLSGDGQAGKRNASRIANQKIGGAKEDRLKELKKSGKFGRNMSWLACGACGQFGHMRTNKTCPLYKEEGHEPRAWQASAIAAFALSEQQGSGALMEAMPFIKAKVSGKLSEKNATSLACGACGQLGHMRTNKKCPLYNKEERELVPWQEARIDALGLVEQQGTKIILKRSHKKGGVVELCKIFEDVVDTLENADCSYLFRKPVPKRAAPDYLHYVKRPMDLSTIRGKVRKLKYESCEDFRNDVLQIAENAHLYNKGRNPRIPPLADRLLELCEEELIVKEQDLDDAVAGMVAESTQQGVA